MSLTKTEGPEATTAEYAMMCILGAKRSLRVCTLPQHFIAGLEIVLRISHLRARRFADVMRLEETRTERTGLVNQWRIVQT